MSAGIRRARRLLSMPRMLVAPSVNASEASRAQVEGFRKEPAIALGALAAIALSLTLRAAGASEAVARAPLVATLTLGGGPLVLDLARKAARREFGSDLLAGISIVASALLGEWLAGAVVVLMLSGGSALERLALGRASSALAALARRAPTVAHRRSDGGLEDIALDEVAVGERLAIFPHEICPVDGVVLEGHGIMDESYLTGEPFEIEKAPGATVISGAVNGASALTIRATKVAAESRYAKIMAVVRETEQRRPRLRRLGDRLGAVYTPIAVGIALAAWIASGDPVRFLAVVVIATPCPLLIAIPVAIIGAISLAARRGIIVRDPAVMERVETCRTIIFDKTGTLSYGAPKLTEQALAPGADGRELLGLAASLERYSKHPLAGAILAAAREAGVAIDEAAEMCEEAGAGLRGRVRGREVLVTGRKGLARLDPAAAEALPRARSGLECVLVVDGRYAAMYRFHDAPRAESRSFVRHLGRKHPFERVLLVSGDREEEVAYLAREVGIGVPPEPGEGTSGPQGREVTGEWEVHAGKSPEEKVAIVERETARAPTLFLGDGVNDAPALLAATVGLAFGQKSDVTAEAAGAVIMDASLARVDEFFHIGRRMRAIALESAVGGMALSILGMLLAATGLLSPVAGAIGQELIDLAAILNALRVAIRPRTLTDF